MLEQLNRVIGGNIKTGVPIKILTAAGNTWKDANLLSADAIGASFKTPDGTHFVPWHSIQGIVHK